MTHEPECWIPSTMDEFYAENGGCYVCQTIRAAYHRGREDAAKAVEQLRIGSFGIAFNGKFYESILDTKEAVAAARGDGE